MAAVASSGVGLSLAARDAASAQPASPAPAATEEPPSAAAAALALTMRRFDPALSDAELQAIAKAIDANDDSAKGLSPKKKRLPNDVPLAEHFVVTGGEA